MIFIVVKNRNLRFFFFFIEDNRTNLIGDFSQSFILPLLPLSNHVNLHPISSETLAELIKGTYSHYISSYLIIDCR